MKPEDTQVWAFATSVALPAIIAGINRPHWSKELKACISILVVIAASFFWVWYSGQWDAVSIGNTLKTVLLTTVTIYQLLWKPLGFAKAIEENVNAGKPPRIDTTDE